MKDIISFFQPEQLITNGGLIILLLVVFAENGLFFGFFLPGDSLLFTAGLFCSTHVLNYPFWVVFISIWMVASLGSFVGYYFGRYTGETLYQKKDNLFFKQEYLKLAEGYFEKYGWATFIIGRFLPIVRTFAPILAGIVKMNPLQFAAVNIGGTFAWTGSLVTLGYLAGEYIPGVEAYLTYIILGLIVLTTIPVVLQFLRKK